MAGAIRAHDWSRTIGDPSAWPPSLKALVGLMLASTQPMFMAWGPRKIWLYNDAFVPILGRKHPGALGRPALDEVWVEARQDLEPLFDRVFGGEPVHMQDIELQLDRAGQLEEAHFAFSYTPVRDDAGSVVGLFGACIETTEQVLAGRRLRAAEQRWRQLFAQAPGFIAVMRGPDHVFEFVNEAYIRLVGRRELLGLSVRDAFPDLTGQGFYELLDRVFETGDRYVANRVAVRLRAEDESPSGARHLDFIYEPILDEKGAVTGIFVEGHDVSEAHRAHHQLEAAGRRQAMLVELGDRHLVRRSRAAGQRARRQPRGLRHRRSGGGNDHHRA
jgi:PAS domain-containing protein